MNNNGRVLELVTGNIYGMRWSNSVGANLLPPVILGTKIFP
jgi:hypothetical protein